MSVFPISYKKNHIVLINKMKINFKNKLMRIAYYLISKTKIFFKAKYKIQDRKKLR
jgi:hypothetical protein